MTPAEEGAYIRLLAYAWSDPGCSLPDDDEELARLSRLGEGWFSGSGKKLRECFQKHPRLVHRIYNKKLLSVRKKQQEWQQKSSEGGVKSGQSRRKAANQMPTKDEAEGQPKVKSRGARSSSSSSSPKEEKKACVLEVFEYWQVQLGHPQSKLTTDRRRRVEDRLGEGYTVQQIKQAIDGCKRSDFHQGLNDRGTKFDDLELICRNGSKLEQFIDLAGGNGRDKEQAKQGMTEQEYLAWVRSQGPKYREYS